MSMDIYQITLSEYMSLLKKLNNKLIYCYNCNFNELLADRVSF